MDAEDVVSKHVGATIETGRMLLCGTLMWVLGLISCVVVAAFVCISGEFRCVLRTVWCVFNERTTAAVTAQLSYQDLINAQNKRAFMAHGRAFQ